MTPLRIAVATTFFKQPLRQSIATAAGCGTDGVQFDARNEVAPGEFGATARRQLLYELRERNLSVASLHFPLRRALYDPDRLDARIAAIRRTMEFASQLGARVVTVRCGPFPRSDDADAADRLSALLDDLARYGNRVGATLSLISSGADAGELGELLTPRLIQGPLGIDFDPAASVLVGRNPADHLRAVHNLATQIQLRDAVRDVDGVGREVVIGRGEVAWDEVLALVEEMRFAGWLVISRTAGDDPAGDAARAAQYVRNVMME